MSAAAKAKALAKEQGQCAVIKTLMPVSDPKRELGFPLAPGEGEAELHEHISLLLASQGMLAMSDAQKSAHPVMDDSVKMLSSSAADLVRNYREKTRLLEATVSAPIVGRINKFINSELADTGVSPLPKVPFKTLVLSKHGVSRQLSFPLGSNMHENEYVKSYKIQDGGVLHNPRFDKRTTAGTFHIADGNEELIISSDKLTVPKAVFTRMLAAALNPPESASLLPYTAPPSPLAPVHAMCSLLLRPIVVPEVPGRSPVQTMEVLVLAPGSLVSCLDFVESVFGNAGDPFLPENDAALDPMHWTGHTGLIVMAPHLNKVTKKALGLPQWDAATEQQRAQGMCWKTEDECYHNGKPFKVCCRTKEGVILSIIADNYFGYCKKEVKSHISFAANLNGYAQEEHSGGTLAFPRYSFGGSANAEDEAKQWPHLAGYSFADAVKLLGAENLDMKPEGYAVDKRFPNIVYMPEDAAFSLDQNTITFGGGKHAIRLVPGKVYMLPNGYRFQAIHHPAAPVWRLIGTDGRGTMLHKPCTVSGGGKSELSKAIDGALMYGPLFVNDPEKDFALVDEILAYDYSKRYKDPERVDARPLLSSKRSIGSVIKLLTPSDVYTDEYNRWLEHFPSYIFPVVYYVKRFWTKQWGLNWRSHFSMDLINGSNGHEVKLDNRKICCSFLRVGMSPQSDMWRTFKTRIDYIPCAKVQMEDDISASVTVPNSWLPVDKANPTQPPRNMSQSKLHVSTDARPISKTIATNCEFRLFQRPDDCVHPGLDTQCEADLVMPGNFVANFEPKTVHQIDEIAEDISGLERFSKPMKKFLVKTAHRVDEPAAQKEFFVCSAFTRLVNGKPSANPRYLQVRPDAVEAEETYASDIALRLFHRVGRDEPLALPVDVIMLGRRISVPKPGLPNLCCYNPLHYQDLPELFMDLICCVSGTSPSTTGAGSEGALTKGPFNALPFSADLNNLLVSYILTGLGGWSTPTGQIGPKKAFGHDISFLAPEVMSRMKKFERDPAYLKEHGYLERVQDFEYKGEKIEASRLGWRITRKFTHFFGRVFDYPDVFEDDVLHPEKQDMDSFAEAVKSLVEVQRIIGQNYFKDGTEPMLCPPLRALVNIMVHGNYKGKTLADPEIRDMFTLKHMLASKWYRARLVHQQEIDIQTWKKKVDSLSAFVLNTANEEPVRLLHLDERLAQAEKKLAEVSDPKYPDTLVGTIGCDLLRPLPDDDN